jgi:hypothetical protein
MNKPRGQRKHYIEEVIVPFKDTRDPLPYDMMQDLYYAFCLWGHRTNLKAWMYEEECGCGGCRNVEPHMWVFM